MTKCGFVTKWYHNSYEDDDFELDDWKCRNCYEAIDIQTHSDNYDATGSVNESSDEQGCNGLLWKDVVNDVGKSCKNSCPKVDLHS